MKIQVEIGTHYRRAASIGARVFTRIEVTSMDEVGISYKILASWNGNIVGMIWRGLRVDFERANWIAA